MTSHARFRYQSFMVIIVYLSRTVRGRSKFRPRHCPYFFSNNNYWNFYVHSTDNITSTRKRNLNYKYVMGAHFFRFVNHVGTNPNICGIFFPSSSWLESLNYESMPDHRQVQKASSYVKDIYILFGGGLTLIM